MDFHVEGDDPQDKIMIRASELYLTQLTNILEPLIFEGFQRLYDEAIEFKEETKDPRLDDYSVLQIFQDYLKKIPKWNQNIIDEETKYIVSKSKKTEKFLNRLIGAVFYSQIKIYSVIRLKGPDPSRQINYTLPSFKNFIHNCYIESARQIYEKSYLFYEDDDTTTIDKQQNREKISSLILKGINKAIQDKVPVEEIMKNYLGPMFDDETENSIQTSVEQKHFENFKKDVKKKVEEMLSDKESSNEESSESEEQIVSDYKQEEEHLEIPQIDSVQIINNVEPEPIPEPEILKEIVNKNEVLVEVQNETTEDSLRNADIKEIISKEEEKRKEYEAKKLKEKEERRAARHSEKEARREARRAERRARRKAEKDGNPIIIRNRDKIKERRDDLTIDTQTIDTHTVETVETRDISESESSVTDVIPEQMPSDGEFNFGGPPYSEDEQI